MDHAISASDVNRRLSEMMREVARGESFIVMSRGRPVGRVAPVADEAEQTRAVRDLVDYLATLQARRLNGWHRQDLYG